ncbi:glycoside hydrolase family 2 protein [Moniliophthora roreri MCA 2997]|uniref:Glycoside hydrolase family 2 protein n=1 Tax=Moniliophthora roreri (strain MCA 2997) TaxID=1381753 RepID=V2WU24_MONRO|nr:glycoside hydrolase family 2 protein [Moniliophthora roreri MCA 2997]
MKLFQVVLLLSIGAGVIAQLPKNGGLTDDRPTYPSPEEAQYALVEPKLRTRWTDPVSSSPSNVWPEYPRPQLRRDTWANLNGVWEFELADSRNAISSLPTNRTLDQRILVPFCIESGLSGIALQSKFSWYRRTFSVPSSFPEGENVVLHFAAVDYHTTVFVNGQEVGTHEGGYDKFFFDITSFLTGNREENELIVFVYDPTDGEGENIVLGKQRILPSHIFYTPCSGIWQTVSLESVPSSEHITSLQLRAFADGTINTTVSTSSPDSQTPVILNILSPADNSQILFTANGTSNSLWVFTAQIPELQLWSPDSPNLYNITITLGEDVISTYTGFRTIEKREVNGVQRFVLNGSPVFQFGPLDQGYWPDGLHSPPSYDAMVWDLEYIKGLGMNFLRKHIKIEPDLFYYAADKLGIMLMQDMPALNIAEINEAQQAEFERQLDIVVNTHLSFPSILNFVIYNEGWGQQSSHPETYLVPRLRALLAGHQLINAISGWNDLGQGAPGDFHDNHHYSTPQCGTPFSSLASTPYDEARIGFQGEFGGVGVNTTIEHLWKDPEAIRDIPQTYEIDKDTGVWNYRALRVIAELREQTTLFGHCNGAVYTQTTDVEGEVNGFVTYDREIEHVDRELWIAAIQGLYEAFKKSVETGPEGEWSQSEWANKGGGEAPLGAF